MNEFKQPKSVTSARVFEQVNEKKHTIKTGKSASNILFFVSLHTSELLSFLTKRRPILLTFRRQI